MKCAVVAVVLALGLTFTALRGDDRADGRAREELRMNNELLAQLRAAIKAEKDKMAKVDEVYQARLAALEKDRARTRHESLARIDVLNAKIADIEAKIRSRAGRPQEKKVRTASIEEKLDMILKKLEELDKRVQKLEGKKTGTLFDGLRP
jgi:hypothetical protein